MTVEYQIWMSTLPFLCFCVYQSIRYIGLLIYKLGWGIEVEFQVKHEPQLDIKIKYMEKGIWFIDGKVVPVLLWVQFTVQTHKTLF